jgi:hypothetical protein
VPTGPYARAVSRRSIPVLLVVMALAVAACGGESAEDEALAEVCDARASIQSHIEALEGLRINTDVESVEAVKVRSTVNAIEPEVDRITDASDELPEDTRQQVEAATAEFIPRLGNAIIQSAGEGGPYDPASLVDGLARAYEETLASIECE